MTFITTLLLAQVLCSPGLISRGDLLSGAESAPEVSCEPCVARWDADYLGTTLSFDARTGGAPIDSVQWQLEPLHDDAVVRQLPLPFSFPFYYDKYDTLAVGVNGFLGFMGDLLPSSAGKRPAPLPCEVQPHAAIAPFWADLALGDAGALYFRAVADSAVVEWRALVDTSDAGPYTFQVRLYPSGDVRMIWHELPGSLTDHQVGMVDARGHDGLSVSTEPVPESALVLQRPANLAGVTALAALAPAYTDTLRRLLLPQILLANPGVGPATATLNVHLTELAGQTSEDLSPTAPVTVEGQSQTTISLDTWRPTVPGFYRLDASLSPAFALPAIADTFLIHSVWDTTLVSAVFDFGVPSDAYALNDPGEWAIRFDTEEYVGSAASMARIYFFGGWPDAESQEIEVELIGADEGGAPDAALSYSTPVRLRGGSGFVTVPFPDGTVVADTNYVVIRQLLPYPDCESIAVDEGQGAHSSKRHWVRVCDAEMWREVLTPELSGDLFVELYLGSQVGITPRAPAAPQARYSGDRILLSWQGVAGAVGYRVLRAAPAERPWRVVTELEPSVRSHADRPPAGVDRVRYALAALDRSGIAHISPSILVTPGPPRLLDPSPVPANPRVTIGALLPRGGDQVRLDIYDLAGRLVDKLHEGGLEPGTHHFVWRGRTASGMTVASGVYLARLEADGVVDQRRIVVLR